MNRVEVHPDLMIHFQTIGQISSIDDTVCTTVVHECTCNIRCAMYMLYHVNAMFKRVDEWCNNQPANPRSQ
jgi:phosphatidate phosphatase APP1